MDPGNRPRARSSTGRRSRSTRRCPTSTSTRSSRRWTPTPAPTCGCCSAAPARACATTPPTSRARCAASRPPAATSPRSPAQLKERRVNIRRTVHNFQLLANALGDKDAQLTQLVDSTNAVFRAFASEDQNIQASRAAPADADRHPGHAPQAHHAGQHARPDAAGAAARRARARPVAGGDAPVPARKHPDHPRPDPALHRGRAAHGAGAPAGGTGPGRTDPDLSTFVRRPQLRAERAGLQPARGDRGLPVLALLAQPARAGHLLHPGRPRPDPPRPVPGLVHVGRCARAWPRSTRC